MRALILALFVVPAAASAQVDLTPRPGLLPDVLHTLSSYAGPNASDAPPTVAWCVADAYRLIADRTEDARIARAARRTADRYDDVAARRLAALPNGPVYAEGAGITVQVDDGMVCRTTARRVFPIRG